MTDQVSDERNDLKNCAMCSDFLKKILISDLVGCVLGTFILSIHS